jgi:hypothetical protein
MLALTVGCLLAALQDPEAALAARIDSQIPWLRDGTELVDMELAAGHHPQFPEAREAKNLRVDRAPLLARAKAQAVERKRLILWYCPRVVGLQMYRAALLDRYMKAVAFTDPGVVDLITSKFVPLRMCADATTGAALGIKPFDFVEPGFIVLTPEGKVVHRLDRLRTFNADWFRAALVAVLRANPDYNRPEGDTVEALIRGGDDAQAFDRASAEQKALLLRRAGKFEEVLRLDGAELQKGLALLALRRFEEARRRLEPRAEPEALYALAAVDAWTGRDPAPRLRALARLHPESPWAWRAAANAVKAEDSLPQGPLSHHVEDFFMPPPAVAPASTCLPAPDVVTAARRAVEFLLRAQHEDGSWRDARYAYWPGPEILPNVFGAVTALAALALLEAGDVRADAAIAKADAYLRDERNFARDRHEECYAHAYRLHYFAKRGDTTSMGRVVARLAAIQEDEGFWSHEYANPFSTAAVVHALATARAAGADVPAFLLQRAADALLSTRDDKGRQSYRVGEKPDNDKSTSARTALCELALKDCGRAADVASGVERYWTFIQRIEGVRRYDYHSDGRLAGFFYFHAGFHTLEAARTLPEPARGASFRRFREQLLAIPEADGSYIDSHELGKSYGTAVALLMLARTRP